jgi:hypothetical protein
MRGPTDSDTLQIEHDQGKNVDKFWTVVTKVSMTHKV